jgi:hypothetical protein
MHFDARATPQAVEALCAIAAGQGWLVGGKLQRALAALQRAPAGEMHDNSTPLGVPVARVNGLIYVRPIVRNRVDHASLILGRNVKRTRGPGYPDRTALARARAFDQRKGGKTKRPRRRSTALKSWPLYLELIPVSMC